MPRTPIALVLVSLVVVAVAGGRGVGWSRVRTDEGDFLLHTRHTRSTDCPDAKLHVRLAEEGAALSGLPEGIFYFHASPIATLNVPPSKVTFVQSEATACLQARLRQIGLLTLGNGKDSNRIFHSDLVVAAQGRNFHKSYPSWSFVPLSSPEYDFFGHFGIGYKHITLTDALLDGAPAGPRGASLISMDLQAEGAITRITYVWSLTDDFDPTRPIDLLDLDFKSMPPLAITSSVTGGGQHFNLKDVVDVPAVDNCSFIMVRALGAAFLVDQDQLNRTNPLAHALVFSDIEKPLHDQPPVIAQVHPADGLFNLSVGVRYQLPNELGQGEAEVRRGVLLTDCPEWNRGTNIWEALDLDFASFLRRLGHPTPQWREVPLSEPHLEAPSAYTNAEVSSDGFKISVPVATSDKSSIVAVVTVLMGYGCAAVVVFFVCRRHAKSKED